MQKKPGNTRKIGFVNIGIQEVFYIALENDGWKTILSFEDEFPGFSV